MSIWHESDDFGFECPSGRNIFCLKNFDTFTRTSVRVSKMNSVARAQLTVHMLTFLQKYLCSFGKFQSLQLIVPVVIGAICPPPPPPPPPPPYVSPFFLINLAENKSWSVSLTQWKACFCCYWFCLYIYVYWYIDIVISCNINSWISLAFISHVTNKTLFLSSSLVLFYRRTLDSLYLATL